MQSSLFGNIYKGKTVFVTGHTGFKGSWLSLWLTKLGANVIGYSLDVPTQPSHFELLRLKIASLSGDILNRAKLEGVIREHKPDIVFHLAAQPIVRKSYVNPVETFETNMMGTVNVLESCRNVGTVKAIVNITSDKCYQNNELDRGYTEDDPMGGDDPYSASKGCAELISHAYQRSFFNPAAYGSKHSTLLASVRAGNVIGGGDWAQDRLIPDIVRAASKNEAVSIRNLHATRPWQHVLEPLSGYLQVGWHLLLGKKEIAETWNFGPHLDASLSVQEVLTQAMKHWPAIRYAAKEDPENFHEAKLLHLDSTKAHDQLHWDSVWQSEETFAKTIAWYREYYTHGTLSSDRDLADYITDATTASLPWTKV